jgi:hypothetical protein
MNKKDNLKLSILTATSLTGLILILLFMCYKLIVSIARTFIYLVGLSTILLVILFYLSIIIFCISNLYKRYKSYKRSQLSSKEKLNIIIRTQLIIMTELILFYMFLYFTF